MRYLLNFTLALSILLLAMSFLTIPTQADDKKPDTQTPTANTPAVTIYTTKPAPDSQTAAIAYFKSKNIPVTLVDASDKKSAGFAQAEDAVKTSGQTPDGTLPVIKIESIVMQGKFDSDLADDAIKLPLLNSAPGTAAAQLTAPGDLPHVLDIGALINSAIKEVGIAVAVLAVIAGIYGGFQYITASGDTAKADAGRRTIMDAVIAMVITALSYSIISFIVSHIT